MTSVSDIRKTFISYFNKNDHEIVRSSSLVPDSDPSLMFVMIGAILIFSPLYFIFKRKSRPIFSKNFDVSTNKNLDKNLIIGAIMFGAGWGLSGLCPGPAISAISFLNKDVYLFVLFMFVGFYLANLVKIRNN